MITGPSWNPAFLCEELLAQILTSATRQEERYSRSEPWNFAAVCRKWRTSCLSNPNLWTYFATFDEHDCHLFKGICTSKLSLTRCILQLQSSKQYLLNVDIDME
ncbi:hypothetical protein BDV98DRAFT_653273 [Pterulicium gracile]|uniref:Uncharacterized protein n=1 Tax=Pterulicium gracile TaxID=1884261 RepID=A0A5C3QVU0_9AGAR|nr:hypothetical protein BDV98DRAFT_653273 [Pterula gracilis]